MDAEFKLPKKPFRTALGRGLSALISSPVPVNPVVNETQSPPQIHEQNVEASSVVETSVEHEGHSVSGQASIRYLPIELIVRNLQQPRQEFGESELKELSESIKTLGVLQPILVRPSNSEISKFEIVAGERRWRAAQQAGLKQMPVVVQFLDDRETLKIALVENVQRENLNPIEEARGYQRLVDEFSLTQKDVADAVGKDRASVANYLRLLKLPTEVLNMLKNGELTMGHAKAILSIREPSAQLSLAKKTVKEELSVRALEAIVSRVVVLDAGRVSSVPVGIAPKSSGQFGSGEDHFPHIIDKLRNVLGTKVVVKHHPSGKGKIEIDYFSEQEFERVVETICR